MSRLDSTQLFDITPEPEDERQATRATLTPIGALPVHSPGWHATTEITATGESTSPFLQIARGAQAGQVFTIVPGITTVGRGDGADIELDDTTVSRRHAELERVGERIMLRDTGSLNGTYLNRQPIRHEVELSDGDEVWTGKYRMRFSGR